MAALRAGYKVVGTTRNVEAAKASNPDFISQGGIWLQLDPGHPNSGTQFAQAALDHDIDVLVNSAGYAFIGGVEDSR